MTTVQGILGRLARMLFPWPRRHVRHAAIAAAREQKERSQRGAADAHAITAQIERLAAENHFAARIAEQLVARHRPS